MSVVVALQEAEAKQLVRDAIAAGIFNDLGSGSNIDVCVITKGKVDYIRPHDEANKKGVRWEQQQQQQHLHNEVFSSLFPIYFNFSSLLWTNVAFFSQ